MVGKYLSFVIFTPHYIYDFVFMRGNETFMYLQTEVNYLGQLYHPNLVKLIGYCLDGENRLLVYEFMPKGSLENHLFRSKFP